MTLHSAILITRLDYYFEVLSMFPFHFRIKKNDLVKIKFGSERKEHILPGDIASDLYRHQSQDEIVEFSFFVVLSYESNLQLGCF